MTTISDPSAMTPDDPRWLSWFMQQRRFDRLSRKAQTGASLITDFAAGVYEMGYPGQRRGNYEISDLVKYARSTGGGRFNSSGVYEWVGNNVPRFDYDPVTLQPLGLLIEEQRTNLLFRSTIEGGTAGTVGVGAVAPTGWSFPFTGGSVSFPVSTLGTIAVSTTKGVNTDRPFIQQSISVLASTSYVLSTRVISSSGTMKLGDLCAWASLPTGSTQAYYKNGVLTTAFAIQTLTYGDTIASVLTVSTTAGVPQGRVGLGASGDTSVTGTCTLTMPQVEAGSFPTSYIPTVASQVTRAADVASVNTLSPWFNASEGTLVAEFLRPPGATSGTFGTVSGLIGFTANSLADRLILMCRADGAFEVQSRTGGTFGIATNKATSTAPGAVMKAALAIKQGDYAMTANGQAPVVSAANVPTPPATFLRVGNVDGGNYLNGHILILRYWPRRLSNTELQAITA